MAQTHIDFYNRIHENKITILLVVNRGGLFALQSKVPDYSRE